VGGIYMNRFAIVEYLSDKIKYTEQQENLIKAIEESREELERARQYFELVSDPQLVDYAIYMEQAAKVKFTYLLSEAKKNGITVNNKFLQNRPDAVV
jgi:hypothetical protein